MLIVFLIAYFVTTQNNAKPYTGSAVVPPINPDGDNNVQPVKTTVCAPTTKGFNGLVKCSSSGVCTGCKEYTDPSNPYQCVAVTGGNGAVDASGRLVQPQIVTYKAPSSSTAFCLGRNTKNPDVAPCQCDPPYTGNNCELMQVTITEPGSYCLPSYAATCNSPTTDSVLTNANTGKGGEYTCACKPEYKGMFYQSVAGGLCDKPLVCGAGNPQMEADEKTVKQYQVYTGMDASGKPVFANKPVFTNRITSYNQQTTEPCVAKTSGFQTVNAEAVPYKIVSVDGSADPTCQPVLYSNKCTAVSSTSSAGYNTAIVRGSGAPGDPHVTRVSPAFFPPVPHGLQRCPDGFSGSGTPSDPCVCACEGEGCWCAPGSTLQIMPTKRSYCIGGEVDPSDTEYTGTWYNAMFDGAGEWNGAFTCVKDLVSAQVKAGTTVMPVAAIRWKSVNEDRVNEVQCLEEGSYVYRQDYNAATASFPVSKSCVGGGCEGVSGRRVKDWDGYRDGPLVNDAGKPWFKAGTGPSFGGQCSCSGTVYRGTGASGGVSALKMEPSYYNVLGDKESWWQCVQDTCASPSRPNAHLNTTSDNWQQYPRCECNTAPASMKPPFNTGISFAETASLPTCIDDPCNPNGFHTTSEIDCKSNDDCGGVCYANKCHYPIGSTSACTSDSDCIRLGIGASTTATCAMLPGAKNKVCLYQDKDREAAGTTCMTNEDCSYGTCTAFNSGTGSSPVGKCSGGCACAKEFIQQPDNSNPVGFTCRSRCDEVSPCLNGGKCSVNWKGEQVCECPPCYSGQRCEISGNGSRLGERCVSGRKANAENRGLGVCCDPSTYCDTDICRAK